MESEAKQSTKHVYPLPLKKRKKKILPEDLSSLGVIINVYVQYSAPPAIIKNAITDTANLL